MSGKKRDWLIVLLVVVAGVLGVLLITEDDDAKTPVAPVAPTGPTVTKVDTNDPGRAPEKPIVVPPQAAAQAQRTDLGDHAGESALDPTNLRNETPLGVSSEVIEVGRRQQEALAENDQLPIVSPLAAPQQAGCESRFVSNYSSRRGVRPRVWMLHYTVSGNRPGLGDMNAVTSMANSSRYGVSWTYLFDNEGHCYYSVRESDKPWTQAALNPVSISAEIINTGKESSYAGRAGLAKLARVISDSAKRWEIPIQRAVIQGCRVVKPGITDHRSGGACAGGHVDIAPPFSVEEVINAVREYRARTSRPPTAAERAAAAKRRAHRAGGSCSPRRQQASLNRRLDPSPRLTVDGQIGPRTRAAIVRFQRLRGIRPAGGYVGVRTGPALGLRGC
jgi:peptidoglycan hydrolase-like protein with peptidoglycan-binding domain